MKKGGITGAIKKMKDEDGAIQLFENIVQLKLGLSDAKNIIQIYLQNYFTLF